MELDNKFYEKPKSLKEAENNLREISGKCIKVITGVTINFRYNQNLYAKIN
jgi:predicted house-cleaning NTP pyrophosphatase (Maf/HAM1 superfamily)